MDEAPIEHDSPGVAPARQLSLAAHVEALLYASKEPATINALATALEVGTREIEEALDQLGEQYAWRGIRLQRQSNKIQLVTAPEIAARVQKYLGLEEVNRLSSAALETLAIIAYNQPITKPQIEMIRGVNCDGVMNTLEARNLISELGRASTVGHPMRYGVSFEFLQYFGLKSTHELPPVTSLDQLPGEVQKAQPTEGLEAPDVDAVPEVAATMDSSVEQKDDVESPDDDTGNAAISSEDIHDVGEEDEDEDEDEDDEDEDEDDDDD